MIKLFHFEYIYHVMSLIALLTTISLLVITMTKAKYQNKEIVLIVMTGIVFFVAGARVLNYIVNYHNYKSAGTPIYVLDYRGFSLYGGLTLAVPILYLLVRYLKKNPWQFLDGAILPFTCGFILMRMGCLFNGCCYGHYTDLPIGIGLPEAKIRTIALFVGKTAASSLRVHPTQIYEMVGAIIALIVAMVLARKIAFNGFKFLLYGALFTLVRLVVLFVRDLPYEDYIITIVYPMIYGTIIFLMALQLYIRNKRQKKAN